MASTRPRPQVAPWLARLTGSLGAFAVGMAGNLVSADIGYRGVVIALAVAAILTATAWLRGFRPDFALVVWVVRGFLLVALTAVVVAMVSVTLSGIAVLVAVLATLGATLIRSDAADRLALLCGVALIAMGAGMIAGGYADPRITANGRFVTTVMGVMLTLFGVAAMGLGRSFVDFVKFVIRMLLDEPIPVFMVAAVGVGAGVFSVSRGWAVGAVVAFLFAAGLVGVATGHSRRRAALVGLGAVVVGTAGAIAAVAAVVDEEALLGAAVAGMSAAAVVAGVTYLSRRGVLGRWRSWLDAAKKDA
jgi:hypothetical protein